MTFSQNAQFTIDVPGVEHHDRAETLARAMQSHVREQGWRVSAIDDWRDCGSFFDCGRGAAELQVIVAELRPREWLLQIAPRRAPGLLGRWLGRKQSAAPPDVLQLACVVHAFLGADLGCSNLRWLWNGKPVDGEWASEPAPWRGAS